MSAKDSDKWYSGKKKRLIPVIGTILGILLLVSGSILPHSTEKQDENTAVLYYTERLENRVQQLCTSVQGVTEAEVLLTLENGSEYVYAQNAKSDVGAGDYIFVTNGEAEDPVLVKEIYPQVRGVAVVCTGGESPAVQQTIIRLLSASLGISSNRIQVAGK